MKQPKEKYTNLSTDRDLRNSLDAAYEEGMEKGIERGIERVAITGI